MDVIQFVMVARSPIRTRPRARRARRAAAFAFAFAAALVSPAPSSGTCVVGDANGAPSIVITASPPDCCYGTWAGSVSGFATNVDADSTMVVLYARTDVYYVQPGGGSQAVTPIACPGGAFSNTTRGGCRYCAILARRSWMPPATMSALPPVGGPILAIACSVDSVPQATDPIEFSGREWIVKSSCTQAVGPGPNHFSGGAGNVWVDALGRLHLRITHRGGKWLCAEVLTDVALGYGRYEFEVVGPVDALDPNVVLGCFSYSDDYTSDEDEIDVEFSRWGVPSDPNAQYVVQPWEPPGHRERFAMTLADSASTHAFTWAPDRVEFESRQGGIDEQGAPIAAWTYAIPGTIPVPDAERMRFNLWLMGGLAPTDGQEVEVVISEFRFHGATGVGGAPPGQPAPPTAAPRLFLQEPAPNPFLGASAFAYVLPRSGRVTLRIHDTAGRVVATLVDGDRSAGPNTATWDGRLDGGGRASAGIYVVHLAQGADSRTRKVVLVR